MRARCSFVTTAHCDHPLDSHSLSFWPRNASVSSAVNPRLNGNHQTSGLRKTRVSASRSSWYHRRSNRRSVSTWSIECIISPARGDPRPSDTERFRVPRQHAEPEGERQLGGSFSVAVGRSPNRADPSTAHHFGAS
jgi:hypothetical protein